jgi:hypothetical protein
MNKETQKKKPEATVDTYFTGNQWTIGSIRIAQLLPVSSKNNCDTKISMHGPSSFTIQPSGVNLYDARASYSVDLQGTRYNATDVTGSNCSVIASGSGNSILNTSQNSVILSGNLNKMNSANSMIGAAIGCEIRSLSQKSVILGGNTNLVDTSCPLSTIIGGYNNRILPGTSTSTNSIIVGGRNNTIGASQSSVILQGTDNFLNGVSYGVATGVHNVVDASFSTIEGGNNNVINGQATHSWCCGEGLNLIASETASVGKFSNSLNIPNSSVKRMFTVGTGTTNFSRQNIFSVASNGNCFAGNFLASTAPQYRQVFQTEKEFKFGDIVCIRDGELEKFESNEDFPIGVIVNGTSGYIAGGREDLVKKNEVQVCISGFVFILKEDIKKIESNWITLEYDDPKLVFPSELKRDDFQTIFVQ